jgi:hypothetical protein
MKLTPKQLDDVSFGEVVVGEVRLPFLDEFPLIGIILPVQDLLFGSLHPPGGFAFGPSGEALIEEFDRFTRDNGVGIVAA